MKGDFTRSTFRPERHYRTVRMQQGRVQTDADWNEQADLVLHRTEVGTRDMIGSCGAPLENPGFGLSGGEIPKISAGHFFVDGILCENDAEIPIDRQPDYPGFRLSEKLEEGAYYLEEGAYYLAYLNVFEQHVTALEDPLIREKALGGPDTTTRQRIAWQVKLHKVSQPDPHCSNTQKEWMNSVIKPAGGLRARTSPGSESKDPCSISPGGGYRRRENQLYRVEIHTAGARGAARFKWSRDNGSIVTSWKEQQGNDLVVNNIGRDQVLGFAPGQTVEVTDDAHELRGEPGTLVRLSGVEGQVLKMDMTDPASSTVKKADFPDLPKIRRWDSDGTLATGAGWIALEDGVEVNFDDGYYQVGDYWLIPARTATDNVEWPCETDGDPIFQPPHGLRHHYCRLAILHYAPGNFTVVEDCRVLFPTLTSLLQFTYLGGDGQESLPPRFPPPNPPAGHLPQPLRVGLTLGGKPVGAGPLAGYHYQVKFTPSHGGHLGKTPPDIAAGNTTLLVAVENGVAQCYWQLDGGDGTRTSLAATRSQIVEARLMDSAGTDLSLPPIIFNASLSLSSQVEYHAGEECDNMDLVETVEQAIDALCAIKKVGGSCCITVGEGGDFVTLDKAILKLVEKKERNIYICLLPGQHNCPSINVKINAQIPGAQPDPTQPPNEMLGHLRISGGAHSMVNLKGPWLLSNFASVTLENMIIVAGKIGSNAPYIHFADCGQVTIRNCQISAPAGAGILLGIEASTSVLLENNQIDVARLSETPGRAFENTRLENLFSEIGYVDAHFMTTALTEATFAGMRARDRREFSTSVSRFVSENAATLNAEESRSLLDTAATLNSRTLDIARVNESVWMLLEKVRTPGRAIYINSPRAQVTLRGNQIYGEVSFYGPSPRQSLKDDEILRLLKELYVGLEPSGKIKLVAAVGTLQLQGNRLTTLTCADALFDQILAVVDKGSGSIVNLANSMTVSDNTFTYNSSVLAALHIDMHHNRLSGPTGTFFAFCFGESGVYVGNCGYSKDGEIVTSHPGNAKAVAANLGVTISP